MERPPNFDYEPGQHIFLEVAPENGAPFSLVSSPTDDYLAFATVIRDRSDFKQELNTKKSGDTLIVSGPYGDFTYEDEEARVGLIAGGIGITPYMGILNYISAKGLDTNVELLYSNKKFQKSAFRDELSTLADRHENVNVVSTITDDPSYEGNRGMIDKEFIQEHVPDFAHRVWYVAGSSAMVKTMNGLLKNQLKVQSIKLDAFTGY